MRQAARREYAARARVIAITTVALPSERVTRVFMAAARAELEYTHQCVHTDVQVYYFKRGSVPPRCTLGSAVFHKFFLQNGSN
jgi:hypothetical protein